MASYPRTKVLIAVLFGLLTLATLWNIWDWGRRENYWGTSDSIAVLQAEVLAQPKALGLTAVKTDRTPHRGFMGKSRPPFVSYSVPASQMDTLLDVLNSEMTKEGWTPLDTCSTEVVMCAQKFTSDGETLLLTVKEDAESTASTSDSTGPLATVTLSLN
ncbi:MAG: hypothetical protein CSA82_00645 [Actinobacteria bacterium]|nr:MAG: hypothetical protein CSA82_00645 [Actinomycetota bacterium]